MKTSFVSQLSIFLLIFNTCLLEAIGNGGIKTEITAGGGDSPCVSYPKSKRAVVIGISAYQDSQLLQLPANLQNAELYAAFLRSREGGLLPADHLQLLTGEQATLASFTAAIGWLDEESQPGDRITIYFAGNARLVKYDSGPVPHVFFADSPLALGRVGSIPLAKLCYLIQEISLRKNLEYNLVFDLNMAATTAEDDEVWRQWRVVRLLPRAARISWRNFESHPQIT